MAGENQKLSSQAIVDAIDSLLACREADASLCPSEVARRLDPRGWRALMATVRETAAMLAREGRLQVTQRGRVLPIDQPWHGPVRFRRPPGRSPHR